MAALELSEEDLKVLSFTLACARDDRYKMGDDANTYLERYEQMEALFARLLGHMFREDANRPTPKKEVPNV